MKKGDKVIIESSNEKGVVMYVNTTTNRAAVKMEDGTGRVFPFDVLKSVAKKYDKGGNSDVENNEMVLNNNKQIKHHTEELPNAIKGKKVPAWVVAKVNRSASDLSDASHYMDGQGNEYAKGGGVGYKKDWLVTYITMQGKVGKKTITLGRMSDKTDVKNALKRMDLNIREVTSISEGDSYANGGRLTSNEDIIEAFLTSNREAKVGNLETTYSTLGAVVLLRNYGTLIAKRRGKTVSISNKKYSMTTTKIQNMIERIANRMGLKVEKIDENKFALGGNTSAFEYSIGGL